MRPPAAEEASPQMRPRSRTATERPVRRAARATAEPMMPPPTMATSALFRSLTPDGRQGAGTRAAG